MRQKSLPLLSCDQCTAVAHALAQMRAGDFFEAHETFEDLFKSTSGDTRTLLHALAQLAASHHQLTLGRARAAVRTWEKARLKLVSVGALAESLTLAMQAFHARLEINAEGPRFLDTAVLGPAQSFPVPELETLHRPSA